jgi:hypothetical protein
MQTNIADCPSGENTTMAHPEAIDANALLRRLAVAAALTAAGFPVSATTLATQASRGGVPRTEYGGVFLCTAGEKLWLGRRQG